MMNKEYYFYISGLFLGIFIYLIYLNNSYWIYLIFSSIIVFSWYWLLSTFYKKLEEKRVKGDE